MGYDRGDSFPFDFEPNGFLFGSKSNGKLSPRSYPIQFERIWNASFLSVAPFLCDVPLVNINMDRLSNTTIMRNSITNEGKNKMSWN